MVIPCTVPSPNSPPPPYTQAPPGGTTTTTTTTDDIVFIAGIGADTWRIPARRHLVRRCRHLDSQVSGPEVRVCEEKRGFELFLRLLDPHTSLPTPPPSVTTCRSALETACRFGCGAVAARLVQQLDLQLGVDSVLEVLQHLGRWCPGCTPDQPSAPPPYEPDSQLTQWCSALLHNCLLIIDEHPEIFLQEAFDSLSKQEVSIILSRESLQLKSEYLLFEALLRWYYRQCMHYNIPQSPTTRQEILGNLILKVRFGLLTRQEFLDGPAKSNIFTVNEVNEILSIIDNKVLVTEGIYKNINVKRKEAKLEPKYLSDRTKPPDGKVKLKKEKSSNTLLNCLTVWTVLFD